MKTGVAVIYGGRSGEHEVSLLSAESVIAALDPERYRVQRFLVSMEGNWKPRAILPEPGANPGIDVVFPVLHGTFGEDGTMQGLLELADLPYVGAGVLGSAVSMDKDVMKRLMRERDLPVVEYLVTSRGASDVEQICKRLPFPVFVKPANLGSSVGISKAKNCEELKAALELAGQFDRKILVERGVTGRELECAVLGNAEPVASLPCEILPSRDFYDYEDKYLLGASRYVLPAELTPEQTREIQQLAIACYRGVECEGMARVDFFLEEATGKFLINEINTIPGFVSISMYPKMWEASGLPYPKLIDRLIELAIERHRERRAIRFSR
ncbi:MAG TPA: D-alanine--D-alanine ligase family protein [Bryobacteraceae bacterium]|jgi:D-alanine-D-alanine ligase|nr:D-alanine--D-alanine ligase family protein [Bryobacteraceae bacterium]